MGGGGGFVGDIMEGGGWSRGFGVTGDGALDVGEVAEVGGPADYLAGDEDGEEDDYVVEVGDGAFDLIDVVRSIGLGQQRGV